MQQIPTSCLSSPRYWEDLMAWCFRMYGSPMGRSVPARANRDLLAALAAKDEETELALRRPESRSRDPIDVMRQRFRWRALRKFTTFSCPELETQAIEGFLQRNSLPYRPIPKYLVPYMKKALSKVLPSDMELEDGRFGPGAVCERLSHAERWEHISKFSFGVCNPSFVRDAAAFPPFGAGYARLCAVDKTWKSKRIITVEPVENTWLQHGIRRTFLKALHRTSKHTALDHLGVDVPVLQGKYALRGSVSGELDTWDLKAASDSIFANHVWTVFPPLWCAWLERCRTTHIRVKGPKGPEDVLLNIYAGMGNATTFIVETLFFWSLCVATAEYYRLGKYHVSVWGDDIILDSRLSSLIRDLNIFSDVGLIVNEDKTMCGSSNPYRESCGVFALNGNDVSVPSISGFDPRCPEDQFGFYSVVQRMAWSRIPEARLMAMKLSEQFHMVRTPARGGLSLDLPWDPPMRVLGGERESQKPKARWNKDLQRMEYKVKVLQPKHERRSASRKEFLLYALSRNQLDESPDDWKWWRPYHPLSHNQSTIRVSAKNKKGEISLLVQFPTRETRTRYVWLP